MYPSIPAGFLSDVFQAARFRGYSVDSLLNANGLSLKALDEPGLRISVNKYSQVMRQLGELTNDAFFGFLSKPVPLEAFNVFCYGLVGCRNLDDLVQYSNDYYSLFSDEFKWQVSGDSNALKLSVELHQAIPVDYRFIIQSLLLMGIRLFGWLLSEDLELLSTHFTYAKNPTDDHLVYLFGDKIKYDAEKNAVCLDGKYGEAIFSCTREQVGQMLKNKRNLFLLSRRGSPFSQSIRRLMLTHKGEGWLEAEKAAGLLNISANQLWRKLKKEGTSFLEIRDQIKRDWALALLEDPANTVEYVAFQLHYSDNSAFRKAFKKWTGLQPLEYRNKLAGR